MSRYEEERFRITTWPGELVVPERVAVPPLVGWAGPRDPLPRLRPEVGVAVIDPAEALVAFPIPAGTEPGESLAAAMAAAASSLGEDLAARFRAGDADAVAEVAHRFAPPPRQHLSVYVDERNPGIVDFPPDFFVHEFLAVDPDDGASVGAFWAEWGPLLVPPSLLVNREVARALPVPLHWPTATDRPVDPLAGRIVPDRSSSAGRHRDAIYDALDELLRDSDVLEGEEVALSSKRDLEGTVTEVRSMTGYSGPVQDLLIVLYQAVFESWVLIGDDDLGTDGLARAPRAALAEVWERRDLPAPASNWDLLDTVVDAVNSGAGAFGPRIELTHPRLDVDGVAYFRPIPRVLTAMCLQAVAFVADGAPARRCADETCGAWFTRQRGRAKAGQTRSAGVLYCSASCAKRSAQRAYRRRRRNGE